MRSKMGISFIKEARDTEKYKYASSKKKKKRWKYPT